jgi:methanogenic corrinoid protein MtbC1
MRQTEYFKNSIKKPQSQKEGVICKKRRNKAVHNGDITVNIKAAIRQAIGPPLSAKLKDRFDFAPNAQQKDLQQQEHAAQQASQQSSQQSSQQTTQQTEQQTDQPDCKHLISDLIDTQIIPRLLNSHQTTADFSGLHHGIGRRPTDQQIDSFAKYCASHDPAQATHLLNQLIDYGFRNEDLMLYLITPAARHLGELWQEDLIDFAQVTNGLMCMHSLTHQMGYEYSKGPQAAGAQKRVMLASAPGSQHILGLTIVSEFFRKEGWQTVVEVSPSKDELVQAVGNEWFDVIGVSVAIQAQLDELKNLIEALRDASRNPKSMVLLGGPIFTMQSFTAAQFCADEICTDPRIAVKLASIQ